MKKMLLCSLLLGVTLLRAADPAPAERKSPEFSATALDWLAGGTWLATLAPGQDGAVTQIELIVVRPENRQGLRFTSTFIVGGKRRPYTNGMYAWDGAKQKFSIFYTDSSGTLSAGDVGWEDGAFAHEFTATDPSGTVDKIKVRLTQVSAEAFTNEIFIQKDAAWMKIVSVRYERPNGGK